MSLLDETEGYYFSIWSRSGKVLKGSTNAPIVLPLPVRPGADTGRHSQTREDFRETFHFTEMGECVLAGRSISADLAALSRFAWWLAAGGGAVLALGLGGGWWLVSRAIRPVEDIEACLEAAQQMRRLTESLLQPARLDAGQERIERRRFDLAQATRACVDLIRPLAAERGIQIHCQLAPADTLADADSLRQVITNLLTNAIHYNKDQGEIRVMTRAEPGAAIVAVADTGLGIAAADQPHLFERFYRADKSRARTHGRSGLGLAICKAIVDAHGGSIELSTQPGAGTTFTVRLPV